MKHKSMYAQTRAFTVLAGAAACNQFDLFWNCGKGTVARSVRQQHRRAIVRWGHVKAEEQCSAVGLQRYEWLVVDLLVYGGDAGFDLDQGLPSLVVMC